MFSDTKCHTGGFGNTAFIAGDFSIKRWADFKTLNTIFNTGWNVRTNVILFSWFSVFFISKFARSLKLIFWISGLTFSTQWRCLYEKNHPTQVRRLTWVRSRQAGVFHFVKANGLYENRFISPRWDLTSTQVRSHLRGMIFLHVNSFWRAVPPRQDCSFSLDVVRFCNDYVKKWNSSYKI